MRIAILSPFYPYRGGIAQFSAMLYNELAGEHAVQAFNFSRLYPDLLFPGKTQYVEAGDQAVPVESKRVLDSINPFTYQSAVREIEKFSPDVLVIAYWMSFFVPGYAHIASRMKKTCKIVTLIHNAVPHEPRFFDKPLARLLFKQSDGFVVLSENVKKDVLSLRPDARILLNPHPLYDHFGEKTDKRAARKSLGMEENKKTLLFFGLIRDYKGLDLLIDAFRTLDDSYQLCIAGECYGSFDKYAGQIAASPRRQSIHPFIRYINDQEIPLLFSAADCLVLPYRSATQSGVVSVAYHFDLPMISTNVGNFADSIGSPGTGIVANGATSQALAEGIRTFFAPGNEEKFRRNILREKENLSWKRLEERLVSFIREDLKG